MGMALFFLFFGVIFGAGGLIVFQGVNPVVGLNLALLQAVLLHNVGDELLGAAHRELTLHFEDERDIRVDVLVAHVLNRKRAVGIILRVEGEIEF